MNKPKSILDPSFKWIPSGQTDLKKTFARIKRELASKSKDNVVPLKEPINGRS